MSRKEARSLAFCASCAEAALLQLGFIYSWIIDLVAQPRGPFTITMGAALGLRAMKCTQRP